MRRWVGVCRRNHLVWVFWCWCTVWACVSSRCGSVFLLEISWIIRNVLQKCGFYWLLFPLYIPLRQYGITLTIRISKMDVTWFSPMENPINNVRHLFKHSILIPRPLCLFRYFQQMLEACDGRSFDKLDHRRLGPFPIERQLNPLVYQLRAMK